jgi:hypothetical protein
MPGNKDDASESIQTLLLQPNRIARGGLVHEALAKSQKRISLHLVLFHRFAVGSKKEFLTNKFGMGFANFFCVTGIQKLNRGGGL